MIGNKTHRIYFLSCGSCSDQYLFSCKILFAGNLLQNIPQQGFLGRHLSFPCIPAGQIAAIRLNDAISKLCKFSQIVLHDRIAEHIGIHCRGDQHRTSGGTCHHCGCQHIIRNTTCNLPDHIGTGRSHQHHIRLFCNRNMLYTELKIAIKGIDQTLIAGQGFKSDWVDEICCIFSHQNMHITIHLF